MKRNVILALLAIVVLGVAVFTSRQPGEALHEVTIYTSVDQVYSEPVLRAFEAETGIRVNALYDAEAAKTVGLVNRLIAEKSAPLADVFWNGEFSQTLVLKEEGVLAAYASPAAEGLPALFRDPEGFWTAFGGRARVLFVNTAMLPKADWPRSIFDLPPRAGEIALANPLFGSTGTHAAALAAALGPQAALDVFEALKSGGVRVVDGNAVVRDMVAAGRVPMGLTDTDDACVSIEKGAPVAVVFLDQQADGLGTLVVPNTVALIAGGPHPDLGRMLADYLLSTETEAAMIESGWVQIPSRPSPVEGPCFGRLDVRAMQVSMAEIRAAGGEIDAAIRRMFQD
ncbi:extracellular solute-binding protein [Maritimibacter sp. HL-12]|uniref:extracellular solute-binding protein n=1 Tax=Maritimibacter sp. HL-12 TaxID=1162418 RepID=UPI000A0EECF6|nr:extracellular solute-binding protein [Maritimibacter sp. HL-12]SMH30862.1 iron(III) transport system substrate-binding protein [Maritimibacter sp. HL-12]